MTERLLVVAAHPDDEVLMAGGTIAKHVQAGNPVLVLVLSDGVASRGPVEGTDIARRREFLAAMKVLGVTQNGFATYPDNQFDTVPLLAIAKDVEGAVAMFQPSIVITHWRGDLNIDHRITHEAVCVACRPQPGNPVKLLLFGECASSTEWGSIGFEPNYFVDVSLEQKVGALNSYQSEMRDWPHARSVIGVEGMAMFRGSSVGVHAAEAFVLGRAIA